MCYLLQMINIHLFPAAGLNLNSSAFVTETCKIVSGLHRSFPVLIQLNRQQNLLWMKASQYIWVILVVRVVLFVFLVDVCYSHFDIKRLYVKFKFGYQFSNFIINFPINFFSNSGAQLKTMHNARLLTCSSLTDVCSPPLLFDDDALATRRLQMNLTLYGRGLNGLVLLVGRDPMFHVSERTG